MLPLADLKAGQPLVGLEPNLIASVLAVSPIAANAVQVVYRLPDSTIKGRLLNSADEASIGLATTERPWSFDGDGAAFQLTCEAKRIDLAFLFDPMMAVHASNVELLPTRSPPCTSPCCRPSHFASSSPTTPTVPSMPTSIPCGIRT